MNRMVKCSKLGIEMEGLNSPPYPGELGRRIFDNISKQAWESWLSHQTMLINEYRLNLTDKNARDFLKQEMEKFLFGGDSAKPPGYNEPN